MPAVDGPYQVSLTSLAFDDLDEISAYTLTRWGSEQRNAYVRDLNTAFAILGENSRLGRLRDDIRPGLLSFVTKQHDIYYRIVGRRIEILRVLHYSQDAARAF